MLVIFLDTWKGSSISWGWLEGLPTDGDIDNEYFPSRSGESDNNIPTTKNAAIEFHLVFAHFSISPYEQLVYCLNGRS